MTSTPARAAFFDVDETLITVKSMLSFLRFRLADHGPQPPFEQVVARLRQAGNGSREAANRAYYQLFAGAEVAAVHEQGQAWFDAHQATGRLFHPPVLDALRRHQQAGLQIVLVSGSFSPCLEPIARWVAADHVLCSAPTSIAGRYTGAVAVSMIGTAKATAVAGFLHSHRVADDRSWAYGDHSSDFDLLETVGNPVVVGEDAFLRARSREHWGRLPGIEPTTGATTGTELVVTTGASQ